LPREKGKKNCFIAPRRATPPLRKLLIFAVKGKGKGTGGIDKGGKDVDVWADKKTAKEKAAIETARSRHESGGGGDDVERVFEEKETQIPKNLQILEGEGARESFSAEKGVGCGGWPSSWGGLLLERGGKDDNNHFFGRGGGKKRIDLEKVRSN